MPDGIGVWKGFDTTFGNAVGMRAERDEFGLVAHHALIVDLASSRSATECTSQQSGSWARSRLHEFAFP